MHSARFYRATAILIPTILIATARPSRLRWPATMTAAVYMTIILVLMWTLQLFPATPLLAPIYNAVTRMVPPPFPLLLVAPAFAFDLLLRRFRGNDWVLGVILGVTFVGVMLAAHWWWAEFMLSPLARNPVFNPDLWDYNMRPGPWHYEFWGAETTLTEFGKGMAIALLTAIATSRLGLWIGKGMSRVQR
jgi:hypothetical protein